MKKLFIAACVMFMFGAVAQAQSPSLTDVNKADTNKAEAKAASDATITKASAVVNNPYTEQSKAIVQAEKAATNADSKKQVKKTKAKVKIDN
ncbi:MAG: hypothetical protein ACI86C_001258 [Candidatus Latescibacterota bacterium]|jgi:hypothetical protein